jgi:cytochrome c-type biogenesis protein CcmH
VKRLGILTIAVALLASGAVLVPPASAASPPSAAALEGQLVCPTCKETLDESDSPVARRMKAYIRTRIAEGATGDQIKSELVAQFGPGVLATPPTSGLGLLAWVLPVGLAAVGATVLGFVAWTWSRRRAEAPEDDDLDTVGALDPELEQRVDDALAGFDP